MLPLPPELFHQHCLIKSEAMQRKMKNDILLNQVLLIQSGLLTPYGDIDLGQYWLK